MRALMHNNSSQCFLNAIFPILLYSDCNALHLFTLNFWWWRWWRFRHDVQTTAAVFYLTSSGRSARSSLYSRQAGVSGFRCHRLERPAIPRRICAVTRGFQTATQDLSVFPFLPRHYRM